MALTKSMKDFKNVKIKSNGTVEMMGNLFKPEEEERASIIIDAIEGLSAVQVQSLLRKCEAAIMQVKLGG